MPTSIAHMIGGYAALEAGTTDRRPGIVFPFLVVVAANLPDLDFLPGIWVGEFGLFHRGPTHSLAAMAVVAIAAGLLLGRALGGFRRVAGWTALAYGSHLVLDMVIPDPSGLARGVPLLWPVVPSMIGAPIPGLAVLDPLRVLPWSEAHPGSVGALMSWSGVRIFLLDAALVTPLIPLAWGVRRIRTVARRRRGAAASRLPLGARPTGRTARGSRLGEAATIRRGVVRRRRGRTMVGAE